MVFKVFLTLREGLEYWILRFCNQHVIKGWKSREGLSKLCRQLIKGRHHIKHLTAISASTTLNIQKINLEGSKDVEDGFKEAEK